jgi:hypothetical protein
MVEVHQTNECGGLSMVPVQSMLDEADMWQTEIREKRTEAGSEYSPTHDAVMLTASAVSQLLISTLTAEKNRSKDGMPLNKNEIDPRTAAGPKMREALKVIHQLDFHKHHTERPAIETMAAVAACVNLAWLFNFGSVGVEYDAQGKNEANDAEIGRAMLFEASLMLDCVDRARNSGEGTCTGGTSIRSIYAAFAAFAACAACTACAAMRSMHSMRSHAQHAQHAQPCAAMRSHAQPCAAMRSHAQHAQPCAPPALCKVLMQTVVLMPTVFRHLWAAHAGQAPVRGDLQQD